MNATEEGKSGPHLCCCSKPDPKDERWTEVWGFNWGFGWHRAYYDELRGGWWHHQYAKVSPALLWRYIPNPNK